MINDVVARATAARERAIAPYSGFKVGAALRAQNGDVYDGCNVESASYGLTICAERVALLKALTEGARKFSDVVVVTDAKVITPPCGACRQLLWEYCGDITVTLHSTSGAEEKYRLSELIPHPFDGGNLA